MTCTFSNIHMWTITGLSHLRSTGHYLRVSLHVRRLVEKRINNSYLREKNCWVLLSVTLNSNWFQAIVCEGWYYECSQRWCMSNSHSLYRQDSRVTSSLCSILSLSLKGQGQVIEMWVWSSDEVWRWDCSGSYNHRMGIAAVTTSSMTLALFLEVELSGQNVKTTRLFPHCRGGRIIPSSAPAQLPPQLLLPSSRSQPK